MRERIQKLLAARGIGSRRQVEAWIKEERVTVNGKPARPGQPIDDRDDVRLDGRRLRLGRGADAPHRGIAYHRPAQEGVRSSSDASPSALAAGLTKRGYAITIEYSVRVRGAFDEAAIKERLQEQSESAGLKGRVDE